MYCEHQRASLMGCQRRHAACSHIRCPATPSVSAWGRAPSKIPSNTPMRSERGTQSHTDEIMTSNRSSTEKLVPAKAAGKSVGTLYHHPLVHSSMLFITLPAVTDLSGGNLSLETFLKGMKSDRPQQQQQSQECSRVQGIVLGCAS